MQIKHFTVGQFLTRCYIITENNNALIIDPGGDGEKIYQHLEDNHLNLKIIVNTHAHFDHIGANEFLQEKTKAKIYIHQNEADKLVSAEKNLSGYFTKDEIISPPADKLLKEGDIIDFESMKFEVIHTPGHSSGGIALYLEQENIVFVGDTIFSNGIGRTDINDSDFELLKETIENKILNLPDKTEFCPGHGSRGYIKDFKKNVWPKMI
ncbi:MBL fold metallo-hydrolase [Halanaerobium hydrogeniformans]|uniref:Beta-lactamase domain protein n=1 Tax=Halanaerobium hydrogeniformans TaxID=656519 RepID=E4RIJ3_HALHG|nr:MBL fold metallo-hydrolase [Halanaerobium hydrogeniformans]ADQ15063.1 beta-lactamase domain protein [Halanaerobium hydrogeniformans]